MNMSIISGRLVRDPEMRTSESGTSVVRITVAVDSWNASTKQKEAQFFPVVVFGQQADYVAKYGTKGREISVVGSLNNNSWVDKASGENKTRTEIKADRVEFHGKGEARAEASEPSLF